MDVWLLQCTVEDRKSHTVYENMIGGINVSQFKALYFITQCCRTVTRFIITAHLSQKVGMLFGREQNYALHVNSSGTVYWKHVAGDDALQVYSSQI